jgi:monoamine oxidase
VRNLRAVQLTRRRFLEGIAAAGGATMTYEAMTALDLLAAPVQERFELRGHVSGIRVAIIGAGLTGLTVAYELGKLGYTCQVLEARPRPGGRVLTVRRGTVSEEDGPAQVCAFDEGLYYNPGAMRIPHHHSLTLEYCRELGVAIEPFINHCDGTFFYQHQGDGLIDRRVRVREAQTDLDGYVAELLSKALSAESLDARLTNDDIEKVIEYLRRAGALDNKAQYTGSSRRGYAIEPGAGDLEGKPSEPFDFSELLRSKIGLYLHPDYDYQNSMLQVIGGTDQLTAALAGRLKGKILYLAAARQLHQSDHGVSITYESDRRLRRIDADYCVCAIPLTLVAALDTDWSPEFKEAVASIPYAAAGKMGLQFKRRFWEQDDGIYGGHSTTDQEIAQIIYPSHGFNGKKGVLIGYYIQGQRARPIGERTPPERSALALEQGARIHPQYPDEFEHAFSVAWHRVPWSYGSWATFSAEARKDVYPLLIKPQGRTYLAGDHVTRMNAWMQGAFQSARQVTAAIHTRVGQERRLTTQTVRG